MLLGVVVGVGRLVAEVALVGSVLVQDFQSPQEPLTQSQWVVEALALQTIIADLGQKVQVVLTRYSAPLHLLEVEVGVLITVLLFPILLEQMVVQVVEALYQVVLLLAAQVIPQAFLPLKVVMVEQVRAGLLLV